MAVEIRDLEAPPDVKAGEAKAADRVARFLKARNKVLSEGQLERLQKHLKKLVKNARRESEPLRKRLSRYADGMEGIVEETNFPFEGASNVTLRYGTGLARTFESAFNKTVYGDEELFYPVLDPGAEQELGLDAQKLTILQEGFNHSFHTACNGLRVLKSGTIPAFRDGTFLLEGTWERRVERVNDERTYKSAQEFMKDYPEAKAAGVSPEAYSSIMDLFLISDELELVVRFSYDHVQHDGIEYRQLLRAKFLVYPTSAQKLSEVSLYGGLFELSKAELKRRSKKGEYYKDQVEKATTKRASGVLDSYERSQLFVRGLSAPQAEDVPFRMADLVVKFDLDGDGTLEQYKVQAVCDSDDVVVVSCRPYDLRHNIPSIVPLKLVNRDNALDGISLYGDGEDIFDQVDTLFRHDNNVMMLTTSPMFMADQTLKDTIDLGRSENVVRPGVTYWVPDPSKEPIKQIQVADYAAASGDNNAKISILSRFVEMLLGVSQGESGQQTPDDPRAPARKTQMLLMQANRRIDQCIDQWTLSFPELAKLHATLLYQFSPDKTYKFAAKPKQAGLPQQPQGLGPGQPPQQPPQQKVQTFDLKLLADPRLKWSPVRRSVTLTPEFALARLQALMQTYGGLRPLLMQGDPVAIELWNRTVRNSGEPQAEKFLYDPQQGPELMQRSMQMAMQQFQLQSKMKAQAKGEETLAKESGKEIVKIMSDAARAEASGAGLLLPQPQPAATGGVQ